MSATDKARNKLQNPTAKPGKLWAGSPGTVAWKTKAPPTVSSRTRTTPGEKVKDAFRGPRRSAIISGRQTHLGHRGKQPRWPHETGQQFEQAISTQTPRA
jgi:hypothetical protein